MSTPPTPSNHAAAAFSGKSSDLSWVAQQQLQLLELAHDAIVVRRYGTSVITFWNRGAEILYGWSIEEAMGRVSHALLHTEFPHSPEQLEADLATTGEWNGELVHVNREGRRLVVASRWALQRDVEGRPLAVLEINRDVTAQRQAEEELRALNATLERRVAEQTATLRQSEARTRAVLAVALDCIVTIDHESRIVEFNPAAERTFGYRRADVLGKALPDLLIPEQLRAPHRQGMARYLATGEARLLGTRVEVPALRADGAEVPVELSIARIPTEGPPLFTAYLRDITARRQAEQERAALLAAEQPAPAAADATRERALFLAEASRVLAHSLEYERTLETVARLAVPRLADWCAVDVLGEDGTIRRLAVAHVDPANVAWARALQRRYPPHPQATSGVPAVLRTGRPELYPELSESVLVAAAQDAEHLQLLREVGLQSAMVVPLVAQGQTLGTLTFAIAESNRRYGEADLAFAEELAARCGLAVEHARLYREAQAAVRARDTLFASVTHDLKNPLTVISAGVQVVRSQLAKSTLSPERLAVHLQRIDEAARRLTAQLDELQDVARVHEGQPLVLDLQHLDLVALVRQAVEAHQHSTERHRFMVEVVEPTLEGEWDPVRLQRVLDNLLSNAIKYSPQGGTITVTLRRDSGCSSESPEPLAPRRQRWAQDDAAPGRREGPLAWAVLSVRDEGVGIPSAELPRIFGRFQRASNVGQIAGTGLGLSVAQQIVEQHGGTLTAESQEGEGSTFTLRLPLSPTQA